MHIFLHIGYPKTGSSAIQSHIFTNQRWFQQRDFAIPQTGYSGGAGGHSLLSSHAFGPRKTPGDDSKIVEKYKRLAIELDHLENTGFGNALISSEGFVLADEASIKALSAALAKHEVTLLVYVRDQVALMQSAALQLSENPGTGEDAFLVGSALLHSNSAPKRLELHDFAAKLDCWSGLFEGKLNIRVRQYNRSLLVDGDVVRDFLQVLGLAPDEQFELQGAPINASIDANAAALLLLAARAGLSRHSLRTLRRVLISMEQDEYERVSSFLDDSDVAYLRDHFRQSNARLFDTYRPENAEPGATGFISRESPAKQAAQQSPAFQFLGAVHAKFRDQELSLWQGDMLVGYRLGDVARQATMGWRASKPDGTINAAPQSTIEFRLPRTSGLSGPCGLKLFIRGRYLQGHTASTVLFAKASYRLDLSAACVTLPFDAIPEDGRVRVVLRYDSPEDDATQTGERPAFQLRQLMYRFVWDPAELAADHLHS